MSRVPVEQLALLNDGQSGLPLDLLEVGWRQQRRANPEEDLGFNM